MKKSMMSKLGLMSLAGSFLLVSCVESIEETTLTQQIEKVEAIQTPTESTDLNARKTVERNYFERFTNQLGQVDELGNAITHIPAYFPGTGVGTSTHMGKAMTFLNQYAPLEQGGAVTYGRPVTQFFAKELAEIGLTEIPAQVSSLTTDGKGNSVWFENIKNIVTPASETRLDFVAEVKIIGGTGKFENASGTATVTGYFNPKTGIGMSTISGRIEF
ncbi:hypothetical protein [Algoriphagus pacificus]|uniref:Uncharacterized protein n=1 Tax=Algoriphagus pacificus TaxID=2811234 RepID=A0ABS3CHX0_9BACT|nr:hypothetical protein [Algoriphagus pacificus]MBN7816695.1 hypothetical protein [Algoriphagus pacificus]